MIITSTIGSRVEDLGQDGVVFLRDEAHAGKKRKIGKWRLICFVSFSHNVVCKLLRNYLAKSSISQFQEDSDGGPFSGIGVGHHDKGLENLLEWLSEMHGTSEGNVSTDDVNNCPRGPLGYFRDGSHFHCLFRLDAIRNLVHGDSE